jgi:hypothetical protein
MATPTPSPSGLTNAQILAGAQGTSGVLDTGPASPVNDITQLPTNLMMYGGVTTGEATQPGNRLLKQEAGNTQTNQMSVAQWENTFYTEISSSPQLLQQFSTEAQLAQLVGPNANMSQLYSAWQKLIVQAYNHNINNQNLTPWDILGNSIPGEAQGTYTNNSGYEAMTSMTQQQAAEIAAKAASKDTNKATTASETDINYTDPDTARYVLNQASQQLLGRQATNAEVASFTKSLNSNEALFPKMTQDIKNTSTDATTATTPGATSEIGGQGQTVVGYDSAGNPIIGPTGTTASTSSTGDTTDTVVSLGEQDYTRYGRQQLAEDAAKSSPDYGAYQAAGPLFQAFLGTLKGAVQGVGSNS